MIPDDATAAFVRDAKVIAQLRDRFTSTHFKQGSAELVDVPPDEDQSQRTVRIRGKGLPAFIQTCEEVCTRAKVWKPVMWAHNGARFDVKFIFDHYANGKRYDVAGTEYSNVPGHNEVSPTGRVDEEGVRQWREVKHSARRGTRQMRITNIGNKILKLAIVHLDLEFRCTYAHHTTGLRELPKIFGLKSNCRKGEFPYGRLKPQSWGTVHVDGLPPLQEFEVQHLTSDRRRDVVRWWAVEQTRRNVAHDAVVAGMEAAGVSPDEITRFFSGVAWHPHDPDLPPEPWDFDHECWAYLDSDVHVLARAMEAYHRKAEDMHRPIWEALDADDDRRDKVVSPLTSGTAPGWAYAMYTTWFMPEDTIYTLSSKMNSYVLPALRGGRTDKRATYVEVTAEQRDRGCYLTYLDFCSLYPSVMKCDVHGTHFPTGPPQWHRYKRPELFPAMRDASASQKNAVLLAAMEGITGFVTVDTAHQHYCTHPVLHKLSNGDNDSEPSKLVFSTEDGKKQTYAWPELKYAINTGQVLVTRFYDGLFFDVGTEVFQRYVSFFYQLKDTAQQQGNTGLRTLAKLLLNSLWGKLGQRSYPIKEWVTDPNRLAYLVRQFKDRTFVMLGYKVFHPHRVHIEYRTAHDEGNLRNTAVHVAAFVSMWGRLVLHRKVLNVHGQRVLYCDTDSAVIFVRPGDHEAAQRYVGPNLGDLTNEVPDMIKKGGFDPRTHPNHYVKEAVFLAPKTYGLRIVSDDPPMQYHKVVAKGFQPSHLNARAVSFDTFKELAWTNPDIRANVKRPRTATEDEFDENKRCVRSRQHLQFVSSMARNAVVPTEKRVDREMSGVYTKGRPNPRDARLVSPFGPWEPPDDDTFLSLARPDHHYW